MLSTCSAREGDEPLSFPLLIILALAICAGCFLVAIFVVRVKEACFDLEPEHDSDIEALARYEDGAPRYWVSYRDEKEVVVLNEKA